MDHFTVHELRRTCQSKRCARARCLNYKLREVRRFITGMITSMSEKSARKIITKFENDYQKAQQKLMMTI